MMALTASISTLSGLWGVLVMDLFQFVLKMGMVIALAVFAVSAIGGMGALKAGLAEVDAMRNAGTGMTGSITSFIPDSNSLWMPMITFLVYISVNWWATWYPGAEPGGGGYIAQRIFSAEDEKHSILATLWFNIAHYAIRPWPWILVALVAVVEFRHDPAFMSDPEFGYIRVMLLHTPVLLRGLMIAAFAAAYMSTIGTQLNWGASYIVNDLLPPFLEAGRIRKALCDRLPDYDHRADDLFGNSLAIYGFDFRRMEIPYRIRRWNRACLYPAVVLVADQCVVRNRGHVGRARRVDGDHAERRLRGRHGDRLRADDPDHGSDYDGGVADRDLRDGAGARGHARVV